MGHAGGLLVSFPSLVSDRKCQIQETNCCLLKVENACEGEQLIKVKQFTYVGETSGGWELTDEVGTGGPPLTDIGP